MQTTTNHKLNSNDNTSENQINPTKYDVDLVEELNKERRFILERTYQFINFGVLTMGLGLTACFSEKAQPHRSELAFLIALLFLGATLIGLFSWRSYAKMRKVELSINESCGYRLPSYWWIFLGGMVFGIIALITFIWIGVTTPNISLNAFPDNQFSISSFNSN